MNTIDYLPTTEAMAAAENVVETWGKHFPSVIIGFRGRAFLCIECNNKHSIHVNEIHRRGYPYLAYLTQAHGGKRLLTLATMLDQLTDPVTVNELGDEVSELTVGIYLPERTPESCAGAAMRIRGVGRMFRYGYGQQFLATAALSLYGFDLQEACEIALVNGSFLNFIEPEHTEEYLVKLIYDQCDRKARECAEASEFYGANWRTV